MGLSRRRFITISAAALGCSIAPAMANTAPVYRWRGVAMGADASLILSHVDDAAANRVLALVQAEIERLEAIFSLYRSESVLARLNRSGELAHPPAELLELLSLARTVWSATDGAFDPTVQPLWQLLAEHFSNPKAAADGLSDGHMAAMRALIGFNKISWDETKTTLRPGMALTFNGIAQGYVTDKIAALLRAHGMTNVLVNMGEIRALGGKAGGVPWRVGLAEKSGGRAVETVDLADQAVATTAPRGTVFDAPGLVGHIIDPRTGLSRSDWDRISVIGASAAIADGLSTGMALLPQRQIASALRNFRGYRVIAAGATGRIELAALI